MAAKRKTNRRQFLRGESALVALGDVGSTREPWQGASGSAPPRVLVGENDAYLLEVGRRAMACQFAVLLNAGQHAGAADAALAALDRVAAVEAQLSIFRPESELCDVNRRAATEEVPVDERLFELLEHAIRLHESTGGAFDITAGPLSRVWGFTRREGRVPDRAELAAALALVGTHRLLLNGERRTVRFGVSDMEINPGAIGKGYALDECTRLLEERGVADFIVHGGQSSVAARGSRTSDGRGWKVGLRHPLRPQLRLAEVVLRNRALGTSGTAVQSFHYRGRKYGHIIDPRSGWPAEGTLSATVITSSAADADALSTALYVMGMPAALEWCAKHSEVSAVFVTPGRGAGTVEIHTANIDEDDWTWFDGEIGGESGSIDS
jgi:thiamine biosynthesis lipoprotein